MAEPDDVIYMPPLPPHFSAAEKAACAGRELALRKNLYPKFTRSGRMTNAQAEREIALMQQIALDYRRIADGEA